MSRYFLLYWHWLRLILDALQRSMYRINACKWIWWLLIDTIRDGSIRGPYACKNRGRGGNESLNNVETMRQWARFSFWLLNRYDCLFVVTCIDNIRRTKSRSARDDDLVNYLWSLHFELIRIELFFFLFEIKIADKKG